MLMNNKPWLNTHRMELVVGVFVAAGFLALLLLSIKVSNLGSFSGGDTYTVTALFDNVGGLKVKSSVSAGGVRIGRVTAIRYDQKYYQSVVTMEIDSSFDKLPDDTTASIYTAGLLGENFVSLEPGGSNGWLKDGSEIDLTQSALVLEQLLGQFMFNKASESVSNDPSAPFAPPSSEAFGRAAGVPGFYGDQPPQLVNPKLAPPGPYRPQTNDYSPAESREGDLQGGLQGNRWGGVPPEGLTGPESPVAAVATQSNKQRAVAQTAGKQRNNAVDPGVKKQQKEQAREDQARKNPARKNQDKP